MDDPDDIASMPEMADLGLAPQDRPNVDVYFGYDLAGRPLVVFVDRFELIAFHSEPGLRRFRTILRGVAKEP